MTTNFEQQITKHLDVVELVDPKWFADSNANIFRKRVLKAAKMLDAGAVTLEQIKSEAKKARENDNNELYDAMDFVVKFVEGDVDKVGQDEPVQAVAEVKSEETTSPMSVEAQKMFNDVIDNIKREVPMSIIQTRYVFKLMAQLQRDSKQQIADEINRLIFRYKFPQHDLIDTSVIPELLKVR